MAASVVVPNAYLLVVSVAAARSLGAAGLGRQSLIAFSVAAASTLAGAGGFVAVMRAVATALGDDDLRGARAMVRAARRAHLVTGTVAGFAVSVPVLWGAGPRAAWLLGGLVTLLATLQTVPAAVLVGAQRWREANGVGLLTGALAVPATLLVLERGGGIEGLFAVEAAVVAVNLVWTGALARRALEGEGAAVGTDLRLAGHARFAAVSTAGVAVTVLVWRRSELVLLAWFSNDVEMARYSVAFAVSALLLTLSERFAATMTPAFTRLVHAGDRDGLAAARARGVRILLLLSLPFVAGVAGAGPGGIRLLYGDTFARSGTVLAILLVALAALPVWSVSAAVLAAHRDAVSPLMAGGAGAALNIGLALWLVPRDGAVGAAAASAGGQLAAIALLHHLVRRRVGPMTWDVASLGRAGLVAVGTGVAAWLPSHWLGGAAGVVLGLLAGATVLVALGTSTRPLPRADVTWLAASLGGRLGERATVLLARAAR